MTARVLTRFGSQAEAEAAARALANGRATVSHVQADFTEDPPPLAFNTALMLQAAGAELGWTSAQTMRVAQRLFEGVTIQGKRIGLITYPRTTGTTAVARVTREARRLISQVNRGALASQAGRREAGRRWSAAIMDGVGRAWTWAMNGLRRLFGGAARSPGAAQVGRPETPATAEAHECIRPTALARAPETLRGQLDPDALALYTLVYRRFLGSQQPGLRYRVTTIEVEYDDEEGASPAPVAASDIDDW